MPNIDSLIHIQDSLQSLLKLKEGHSYNWKEDINFYLAIAGGVGTLIGIYAFWLQWKSKKQQDYVFKLAQTVMEKEDTQSELSKSKEELTTIEKRITNLQDQIKKDIPIEAKKAVLLDRLNESMENLSKYHGDIISTKKKLSELGSPTSLADELSKSVQNEIEPKYVLKERVSNYKTLLTVASSLSGLAFATLPSPIDNFIGIVFLISGVPLLIQILRYTVIINSFDKQKVNLLVKIVLCGLISIICLPFAIIFFSIYRSNSEYGRSEPNMLIGTAILSAATIILGIVCLVLLKKYKRK